MQMHRCGGVRAGYLECEDPKSKIYSLCLQELGNAGRQVTNAKKRTNGLAFWPVSYMFFTLVESENQKLTALRRFG
jgi:hypothetical protein